MLLIVTATLPEVPAPTSARATYGGLLRRGEFRALFLAHAVSMLGTMVAEVALTVLIFRRTGSPALAALTFTVGFLPFLFGGALFSGLVDRWPARRTMVSCDLLSAAVFTLMALPGLPVAGLLGLAFAGGLIMPVFAGTRTALLPQLLGSGSTYMLGRGLMRIVAQGSQVIGYALGGLLLAVVGSRTALLIDAGSFVVSSVVVRTGIRAHAPVGRASSSLVRDSLRGVRSVLVHRPTRHLLLFRWLVPACAIAPEALAAPYVHALHGSQQAIGLYLAATPAAMVVTDLIAGRLLGRRVDRRYIALGGLMTTAPLLAFVALPGVGVAMALLVVVGIGYWHDLPLDVLLLDTAPEGLQARALAVDQSGLMFVQGLAFGVWGAAGQLLSLRVAITIAGACGVAVVLAWLWASRGGLPCKSREVS